MPSRENRSNAQKQYQIELSSRCQFEHELELRSVLLALCSFDHVAELKAQSRWSNTSSQRTPTTAQLGSPCPASPSKLVCRRRLSSVSKSPPQRLQKNQWSGSSISSQF